MGLAAPVMVDGDPARDRQHPGAQVVRVPQPSVGAQRAQEGLLVGVLGRLGPDQPAQLAEDGVPVLLVERFERRNVH